MIPNQLLLALFLLCTLLIFWVYVAYPGLLLLAARSRDPVPESLPDDPDQWPSVTVVVAAYNEEHVIARRLRNLLDSDYPASRLDILLASDGSDDGTARIAESLNDARVTVLEFGENRGRETVHTDAITRARGDIVVVTDADTSFEPDFIRHCAAALYADPTLGCVVGNLSYRTVDAPISHFEGTYWRYDMAMKRAESALGLIHNGCGPGQAFRKRLFQPLRPWDDVDAVTILHILVQGYRVRFLESARAYDVPPASVGAELKGRIRQTSRSFISGLRTWHPVRWIQYPLLSVSYLSHRILRWLSPFFFAVALISNAALASRSAVFMVTLGLQLVAYTVALLGWALEAREIRVPIVSFVFSFAVANVGMLLGVLKGVAGRAPRGYRMPMDPGPDD